MLSIRKIVVASILGVLLAIPTFGETHPNYIVATCSPSLSVGGMEFSGLPDQSILFTLTGVKMSCLPSGDASDPCTFCVAWQLSQSLGHRVWQVVQPPYPVSSNVTVACNTSSIQDISNKTPPLGYGLYRMVGSILQAPCGSSGREYNAWKVVRISPKNP